MDVQSLIIHNIHGMKKIVPKFEGAIDGQLPSPSSQLFMDVSNWLLKLNPLNTKVIRSLKKNSNI
jgi:hypothetical protein